MILSNLSPEKGWGFEGLTPFQFTNHKDCQSTSSPQHHSPSQDTAGSWKDWYALKSPCWQFQWEPLNERYRSLHVSSDHGAARCPYGLHQGKREFYIICLTWLSETIYITICFIIFCREGWHSREFLGEGWQVRMGAFKFVVDVSRAKSQALILHMGFEGRSQCL